MASTPPTPSLAGGGRTRRCVMTGSRRGSGLRSPPPLPCWRGSHLWAKAMKLRWCRWLPTVTSEVWAWRYACRVHNEKRAEALATAPFSPLFQGLPLIPAER